MTKTGICISGLVRDLAVELLGLPYKQAVQFSQELDKRLQTDWLELYDGTTYRLDWRPLQKEVVDA